MYVARGEVRPRQTRQLPRAVDLKGRFLLTGVVDRVAHGQLCQLSPSLPHISIYDGRYINCAVHRTVQLNTDTHWQAARLE
jgi:hypothetical protein